MDQDAFDTWSVPKKLAAMLYCLEHLDPEELSREQCNKVLNRCSWWVSQERQREEDLA